MIPIAPYSSVAHEDAVHGLRHTDCKAPHPTLEPRRRVRLYQQVQMIRLDAELKDPEP